MNLGVGSVGGRFPPPVDTIMGHNGGQVKGVMTSPPIVTPQIR